MTWESLTESLPILSIIFSAGIAFDRLKNVSSQLASKTSIDSHNGLAKRVDDVKLEISTLQQNVWNQFNVNKVSERGSPLRLSEYGKKILGEIEFSENIFPLIKDILLTDLEKYELRNPYDVQEKAQAVVRARRDDPIYDDLKKITYATGNNLDEVLAAIFIPLRDYYFEKYPEIID